MKRCVGLWALLLCSFTWGQKSAVNLNAIDWNVQAVNASSTDSLAVRLTAPYATELEKVRAIFSWICRNIAYNASVYRPRPLPASFVPEPDDTASQWRSADEMVAQKVLRRRKAVCDGYSRLFKVLCQYAGIEAAVINGYVRTSYDRAAGRFRTNHTWNAVRIDSAWHLLDVTWASGYMTYADEYVPSQNDYYFLTPPEVFIRDHFPEELRWSLLPQPSPPAEFKKMPFRSKSFIKYNIAAYSPANGILDAEVGETLRFSLDLKDGQRSKKISPDPFLDTADFALSPLSVFIHPQKESGNKVFYSFVLDPQTEWIHLLYNGDVILRYRVNRKQSLTTAN